MRRSLFLGILSLVVLLLLVSCIRRRETGQPADGLERLLSWMNGSFSSRPQSLEDSAFLDIRLEMTPIWTSDGGGYWLYVEQAAADNLGRPYRQRIYNLTQLDDSTFASAGYELPDPERFIGQWRNPDAFAVLTPDSLIKNEGCTIFLHPEGDSAFVGGTLDEDCRSDLRGAAYATSKVRITDNYLYSWDRGFDSTGSQVWGAEKGGYRFEKMRNP
jgi:hypothetical protein